MCARCPRNASPAAKFLAEFACAALRRTIVQTRNRAATENTRAPTQVVRKVQGTRSASAPAEPCMDAACIHARVPTPLACRDQCRHAPTP